MARKQTNSKTTKSLVKQTRQSTKQQKQQPKQTRPTPQTNNRKKQKRKRPKRKISVITKATLFILLSAGIYFTSITILMSHNILIARQVNQLELDNDSLAITNKNLEVELVQLTGRTRIVDFATKRGFKVNGNNIVTIKDKEGKEIENRDE